MWLYLKIGFYSVVHKPPCQKDELLVRTRSKIDIDNLQKLLITKYQFAGNVMATPKADYAYRMVVPRNIMAAYLSSAMIELDYDNFKSTIGCKDYERHQAYMKCWESMYEWQMDLKRLEMIETVK